MKKLLWPLTALIFSPLFSAEAQNDYRHDFKTVPDDPYNVLYYELDNGLKVYLSVNKDEPRISTNIAVRTGSKNDPAEYTGLAHYLEHMLFKGTSRLGSLNWKEEKKLLEQISAKYEVYGQTTDPDERKAIYREIDSLSNKAAEYVATNEYDQMISELGARGTNAYTSLERTVYLNDIPTNEMEKWMMIESERFSELTLRLFHTELEAVYEEFNRTQDSDGRQAYYKRMELLFPEHPYGTQTTIGEGEHLKNPSMVQIQNYFDKYYVPNNMAIIMVGDLDPDKTLDLIKKHFGTWKKGPQPEQFTDNGQPQITTPIEAEVVGSEAEFVNVAYRTGGIDTKDGMMADLVTSILYNGDAGLIDQNLNNQQKVIRANAYSSDMKDYSTVSLSAYPREGQTLEEARDLLLDQIKLMREGQFDETLIPSIVKNAKKRQMQQAEQNNWKAYTIINAFVYEKPWDFYAGYYDEMAKITKDEVVEWTNKNLNDNYVAVYKRQGERNPFKIEKPEINPVAINRGVKSEFRREWEKTPSSRIEPHFIDFDKDLARQKVGALDLFYVPNTTNELFQVNYIFDMGSRNDKELALAIEYLPYLGTENYTVDEINRKFYDLGLDYSVSSGEDRVYVSLSGLNESLEEGIVLFEEMLSTVQGDEDSYKKFVEGIEKKRKDAKLSKSRILYGGLWNYARYGSLSPFTDILTTEELKAIDPADLAQKIRGLKDFKHKIFYYGPEKMETVAGIIEDKHRVKEQLLEYPERKQYQYVDFDKDVVYFVEYDMVQTEMAMVSKGDGFNQDLLGPASIFNQYFGGGLSSIVFQEIRESKALAYSAYSYYTSPSRSDEPHFLRAYIGTQSDKLKDAVGAMKELMNRMPREESQFEQSKIGALKQMETNPVTKSAIYWSYQRALDRGLARNPRPALYQSMKAMNMDELEAFFNSNIKGKRYAYLVIGKKENMDMEALAELGEVHELTLEEIFGY